MIDPIDKLKEAFKPEKINDGGPAFLYPEHSHKEYENMQKCPENCCIGMTLRDYFAGQALTGLLAKGPIIPNIPNNADEACELSYKFADRMLKAREDNQ